MELIFPLLLVLCVWLNKSAADLWAGQQFSIEGSEILHETEGKDFHFIRSRDFFLPSGTISYSKGDKARKLISSLLINIIMCMHDTGRFPFI